MGRPTDYSEELANEICARCVTRSLHAVAGDEDMPAESTIYLWLGAHEEFSENYARAREARADRMFEEMLAIADTPQEGERHEDGSGGQHGAFEKTVREDMLGHRRLQVDTRRWALARMAPKKYGDKVALEHAGKDGGPVVLSWLNES